MAATPTTEDEVKLHPYQRYGPKGAYETKQVIFSYTRTGPKEPALYVRVDMPGVPDDGVKVFKNSEQRTVTFNGKAPMLWPHLDTSDRVYAGYVALDRDPAEVEVNVIVKDGCVRMLFPNCDGSLHFLSPNVKEPDVVIDHDTVEVLKGLGEGFKTLVEHSPDSRVITLRGGTPVHINPSLLSGVKGVYEHKIVNASDGEQMVYLRLDIPDVMYKRYSLSEVEGEIMFSGDSADPCSPFDNRGRGYIGTLKPNCDCCVYEVFKQDMRHGVMRFVVRKARSMLPHPPCNVYTMKPPSRPGEDPTPVVLGLDVNLMAYFDF